MGQLQCSSEFAVQAYMEMNIHIAMDELCCSRDWAFELLQRHAFDPCLVRMLETDFNHQADGHLDDASFQITELRTSWGSTAPIKDDVEAKVVYVPSGRC